MKVVQICTYDAGGAGNAAVRLHQGLRKQGVESELLCLIQKKPNLPNHYAFPPNPTLKRILGVVADKLGVPFNKHKSQQRELQKYQDSYEYFSFAESDFRVEAHPLIKGSDVIHLHWISGFINYPSFFKDLEKPIVWTLHDMNPFSGSFHYENDELQASESLKALSMLQYQQKKKALSHLSDKQLYLASPSKWLMDCAKNSEILQRFSHFHVPNGLDTDIFQPREVGSLRIKLNLPKDKLILLFVSQEVDNPRKGFHLLKEALESFSEKEQEDFVVLLVGSGEVELNITNLFRLGKISSAEEMANVYSLADAFIMPSLEDNLPNVMLESLACGTPVIAFNIGGVPDAVQDGENGIVIEPDGAKSIKRAISNFLEKAHSFNASEISANAHKDFSVDVQSNAYLRLYENILSQE